MSKHILLEIDTISGPIFFKPFLEESNVNFNIETVQANTIPLFMNSGTTVTRALQSAILTFNVFPDSRDECIENYKKLKSLLNGIKPVYAFDRTQLIPHKSLFSGFISVKFAGFLPGKSNVKLKLTSFSYQINQELGYLQVPYQEILTNNSTRSFVARSYNGGRGNKMIPIGFNIKIEGDIIQPFSQTAVLEK